MSDVQMATLRAAIVTTADPTSVEAAAAGVGRRPIRTPAGTVLGRDAEAPTANDLGVASMRLTPSALIALGLCIGLAWQDRDAHPYPGIPVELGDLLAAAQALGIEVAASRHLVGAINHLLSDARLLTVTDGTIRLGPALAGWATADLEVLRRNLDALPDSAAAASS